MLKYIGAGARNVDQKAEEEEVKETTTEDLAAMSSPMDSAVDMKKRKRLA